MWCCKTCRGHTRAEPTPAHDVSALQKEQVVYVPNDNYRNPSRLAKHQQDLLKDYLDHIGALAGQEDRI